MARVAIVDVGSATLMMCHIICFAQAPGGNKIAVAIGKVWIQGTLSLAQRPQTISMTLQGAGWTSVGWRRCPPGTDWMIREH